MSRAKWTDRSVDVAFAALYDSWENLSHKSSPFSAGNPRNAACQTPCPAGTSIFLNGKKIDVSGWSLKADPYGVGLDVAKKLERLARDRANFVTKARVIAQVWAHALQIKEYASAYGACSGATATLEFPAMSGRSIAALEALESALALSAKDRLTADSAPPAAKAPKAKAKSKAKTVTVKAPPATPPVE